MAQRDRLRPVMHQGRGGEQERGVELHVPGRVPAQFEPQNLACEVLPMRRGKLQYGIVNRRADKEMENIPGA